MEKPNNRQECLAEIESRLPRVEVTVSPCGFSYLISYPDGNGGNVVEPMSRVSDTEQVKKFVRQLFPKRHVLVLPTELR